MHIMHILGLFLILLKLIGAQNVRVPGSIYSFRPGGQYVMITFEDSPHSVLTPKILEILKQRQIAATFFVSGSRVLDNAVLVRRILADGHDIGSNGWRATHYFTKLNSDALHYQITKTHEVLRNVTNHEITFIRPPHGSTNVHVNRYIKSVYAQYSVVLWSLYSKDMELTKSYAGNSLTQSKKSDPAQQFVKNIVSKVQPGDILLFHSTVPKLLEALPILIDELTQKGYEFLTITQVMSFPDDSPR